MVMAILVMLVLSSLSLTVLGRTLSVASSTRAAQDHEAALAAADAGLADALFALDQFGSVQPAPAGPEGASPDGSWAYATEKIDDTTYVVRSRGRVGRANHAISARVTRSAKYPFALFSRQTLTVNGRLKFPPAPTPVPIGSNGTTVCHGTSADTNVTTRATNNKDCPGFEPMAREQRVPPVEDDATGLPCPVGGVFTGDVHGTYVCRQDVSFQGTVSPAGPLVITLLPDVDGRDPALDLGGAVVNVDGPATDVQILKAGTAPITFDSGNTSDHLTFRGVIYAPETTFEVGDGGKWISGSFVFNEVKLNGGPNFTIDYDLSLETLYDNDWTLSRYTQIPSTDPRLPALA